MKHPLDVSVLLVGILAVAGRTLVVAWHGEGALAHCCWALSRFGTQEHTRREGVIDILASARHLRGLRSPFEVSAPRDFRAPVAAGAVFLALDYPKPHKPGRPLGKITRKISVSRETCHLAPLFVTGLSTARVSHAARPVYEGRSLPFFC